MAENPALFVRASTPNGHRTVSAVAAARAGWQVLDAPAVDGSGRPRPPKPRVAVEGAPKPRKRRTPKLRAPKVAATPTTEPEAVSGDTPKE